MTGAANASDSSKTGKKGDRNDSSARLSSHDDDDHDDNDRDHHRPREAAEKLKRKKSKHAPTEMSSSRRDYFASGRPDLNSSGIGVTIGANRYRARDPRTVSLSGRLDTGTFNGSMASGVWTTLRK
jgi:hypothetical protein